MKRRIFAALPLAMAMACCSTNFSGFWTGSNASAQTIGVLIAHTYYVATTGSDSGACTAMQPCATVLRATQLAHPGNIVLVEHGTYGPQTITATGSSEFPITVVASGTVKLTRPAPASLNSQNTALLRILDSSYVRVRGFTVIGMKGRRDYIRSGRPYGGEVVVEDHGKVQNGVPATGLGVVLARLTVRHTNNTCIKTEDAESDVTIRNNFVSDCGQPGNTLDHGIYVSGPRTLISGNRVNGASGFGIHAYGTYINEETITGNTVSHCHYAGIIDFRGSATITRNTVRYNAWGMWLGAGQLIENNVFVKNDVNTGGSHGYGILFTGMGGDSIIKNTFFHDGVELQNSDGALRKPIVVLNNTFVGTDRYSQVIAPTALRRGDLFDFNLYNGIRAPLGFIDRHPHSANPKLVRLGTSVHFRGNSRTKRETKRVRLVRRSGAHHAGTKLKV